MEINTYKIIDAQYINDNNEKYFRVVEFGPCLVQHWVIDQKLQDKKSTKLIRKYGQTVPREFVDSETQTIPVNDSDQTDSHIYYQIRDVKPYESILPTFSDIGFSELPSCPLVPSVVHSISVEKNEAIVSYSDSNEKHKIGLPLLISLNPKLVAQFFVENQ